MIKFLSFTLPNILSRLISFFIFPVISHFITPDDYGILSMSIVLSGAINALFTLSVNNYIYKSVKLNGEENAKKDIKTSYTVTFFCTTLLIILYIFIAFIFFEINKFLLLSSALIILVYIDFFFCAYYRDYYRATNNAKGFAIADIIKVILFPMFTIIALKWLGFGVYSILIGNIAALSLSILYNIKSSGLFFQKEKISSIFDKEHLKTVYIYTLPYVVYTFAQMLLTSSDRFIIGISWSSYDVGIYATAFTIATILGTVGIAINNNLIGVFMKSNDQIKLQKSINLYARFIVLLFFALMFGSSTFLQVFMNEKYWEAAPYISILLIGQLFSCFQLICMNVLGIITFKTKIIPITTAISTIFNVCLNIILVPIYGLYAACIISSCSFVLQFVISHSYATKHFKYKIIDLRLVVYVVLFFTVFYIADYLLRDQNLIDFIIRGFLVCLMFFIMLIFEKQEYKAQVKINA